MWNSRLATKTITVKLDAYEKLRRAKRRGESFTDVGRRAVWVEAPSSGATLREHFRNGGSGVSEMYLAALEAERQPDERGGCVEIGAILAQVTPTEPEPQDRVRK